MAGTGRARYDGFRDQVRTFQSAWTQRYAAMVFAGTRATRADWDARPVFRFEEEPDAVAARRGVWAAGTLLGLALLPAGVAAFRVLRHRS